MIIIIKKFDFLKLEKLEKTRIEQTHALTCSKSIYLESVM